MMTRCFNQKQAAYKYYGAKGITVCEAWLKFEGFYADMGNRPSGLTLDRIDSSGGYCKTNCRWATKAEQSRNRAYAYKLTHMGETKSVSEWCDALALKPATVQYRKRIGWTDLQALQPVAGKRI
jgi:hypothetical protein